MSKKTCRRLGQTLRLLILSDKPEEADDESACLEVYKVYLIKHQIYEEISAEHYLLLMIKTLSDMNPYLILLTHNDLGGDMAPHLAARLKLGVCLDCLDLELEAQTKLLLQTKPVYGGRAAAGCSGSKWIVAVNKDPEAHILRNQTWVSRPITGNFCLF